MPESNRPTALEIVATWPTEPEWNFALVNVVVAPDDTHPIAVPCYDECVDSKVVFLPDGSRRHVAFVREATTKEYLWRRNWIDMTADFMAIKKKAAIEQKEANKGVEHDPAILAVLGAAESKQGATALFVGRQTKLSASVVEHRLAQLVASGEIERIGEGGPVILFRAIQKAA